MTQIKATHGNDVRGKENDVAVVGYGPASEVLALALGSATAWIPAVDRWAQPCPLPRLSRLDGEICRAVAAIAVDTDITFAGTPVQDASSCADGVRENGKGDTPELPSLLDGGLHADENNKVAPGSDLSTP